MKTVMTDQNIRLTSTEMATLWTTYINDTMAECVLSYFLNKVEDNEIRTLIAYALSISVKHIQELTNLFNSEDFPVPHGFTEEDVNIHAKRLFSDSFFVYYIKNMSKVGVTTYGMAFAMASRADIKKFFNEAINQTVKLDLQCTELMLSKGIYIRPPHISNPDHIDFVRIKVSYQAEVSLA